MNVKAIRDYQGEGRCMQHAIFLENVDKLKFEPDDVVLDVGCGTGEEAKSIAAKVAWITGFDISEKMIAEARKNNSGPNITYSVWNALTCGENPDWRERFDKAFSNLVLHWVSDLGKALTNVLACLKPGAEALFIAGNRTDFLQELTQYTGSHYKWGAFLKNYEAPVHNCNLSQNEFEELFRTSGWADARCEVKLNRFSMNATQTQLFLKTTTAQTALIPEEYWQEYLEDVAREAQSRYSDPTRPGNVIFPIEYAVVYATKPLTF